MEQLIIEVNHNKDLWCKVTKHQYTKQRKFYLAGAVWLGIFTVLTIVSAMFFKNPSAKEIWPLIAYFFLIDILVLSRFSSKSISKMIDKNIQMYPLRSKYTFSDECFIIETDFPTAHGKTQYEYASILNVHRIDKKHSISC